MVMVNIGKTMNLTNLISDLPRTSKYIINFLHVSTSQQIVTRSIMNSAGQAKGKVLSINNFYVIGKFY